MGRRVVPAEPGYPGELPVVEDEDEVGGSSPPRCKARSKWLWPPRRGQDEATPLIFPPPGEGPAGESLRWRVALGDWANVPRTVRVWHCTGGKRIEFAEV